jgi:hypothetical protein
VRSGIVHNTAEIRRRMLARPAAVLREIRAENAKIAEDMTKASVAELERDVYSVPPDRPRSNVLKNSEEWVVALGGLAVVHRNTAPHYKHRWKYGKAGGRPAKPPKRASWWHRQAAIKMRGRRAAGLRAAIRRGWQQAR